MNDAEQPEDTDTRLHNQQKESEKEKEDSSDGKGIKGKNENQEVPHAGDDPRIRESEKKQKKKMDGVSDDGNSEGEQCKSESGLDTEQPEDNDTRLYNQPNDSEKDTFGVSDQSDAEQEDHDRSDGKCIRGQNENNDLPNAGDGPRLRKSNKKVKTGLGTDTRLHKQQKESEREDHDTSGGKFISYKNESQEVPYTEEGARLRKSSNKQKIALLDKGDTSGRAETRRSSLVIETCRKDYRSMVLFGGCILLIVLVSVVVIRWFMLSPPAQEQLSVLEVFCQELNKVQASFPSQRRELWRRSRIHLQRHLNLTNPTEPVSLILTSGRGAEKTLHCLAQQLAAAFSNTLNSSVLNIDGTSKSGQDSDLVKLDIDTALKNAFADGTQAAVIHRFEELPPGSTLIFYRYCDHENSAFKKVFLAFTVLLQEEMDFPPNVSLGMVEEVVQDYLREKFVSSDRTAKFNRMDTDKLSGLWSRISHLILPVATEQAIEQHGCQALSMY